MDKKQVLGKMQKQVDDMKKQTDKIQDSTVNLLNAVDLQQAHLVELAATIREAIAQMDQMRWDNPGPDGTPH